MLFNYGEYASQIEGLTTKVREANSQVRDKLYLQSKVKVTLGAIKTQRSTRLSELALVDQKELEENLQNLKAESVKLRRSYERIVKSIEHKQRQRRQFIEELSGLSNENDEIESEVMRLENEYFKSIYNNPKIQLAGHKLRYNQICMFCNQKLSLKKAKDVLETIDDLRKCPVCSSDIGKATLREMEVAVKGKALKSLSPNRKADGIGTESSLNQSSLDSIEEELSRLWGEKETLRKQLEQNSFDIDDINLMLSKPEMEKKEKRYPIMTETYKAFKSK